MEIVVVVVVDENRLRMCGRGSFGVRAMAGPVTRLERLDVLSSVVALLARNVQYQEIHTVEKARSVLVQTQMVQRSVRFRLR
jgi:SOS-response transcriptional repressor LexA